MELADELRERLHDLVREARRANQEDRKKAEALGRLLRVPEWKFYRDLLDSRIQGFADELLRPAASLDGMVSHEFVKGAMYGLTLARTLPQAIVETLAGQLDRGNDDE